MLSLKYTIRLWLDRPEAKNACTGDMWVAIGAAFRELSWSGARAIVLNAGAFTHTSLALYDAIKAITTPVIEVHLSNPAAREDYRHKSYVGMAAKGSIAGFGAFGYLMALEAVAQL